MPTKSPGPLRSTRTSGGITPTSRDPRAWIALLVALTGCVVNPVPTPASKANEVPPGSMDSENAGLDAGRTSSDGTKNDVMAGAVDDDAVETSSDVTATDAVDDGTADTDLGADATLSGG